MGVTIMKIIDKIALVLVIIGAINWGLIGIFNFNLVKSYMMPHFQSWFLGDWTAASKNFEVYEKKFHK